MVGAVQETVHDWVGDDIAHTDQVETSEDEEECLMPVRGVALM